MILSMPFPGSSSKSKGTVPGENVSLWKNSSLQESPGEKGRSDQTAENGQGEPAVRTAAAKPAADYEKELEERIAQILKSVEGVGKVDVMVVLSSSGEKVYRTDRSENTSTTKEKDASGGERDIASSQSEENTIFPTVRLHWYQPPDPEGTISGDIRHCHQHPGWGFPHCAGRNFPGYGSIIRAGTA